MDPIATPKIQQKLTKVASSKPTIHPYSRFIDMSLNRLLHLSNNIPFIIINNNNPIHHSSHNIFDYSKLQDNDSIAVFISK